MLIRIIVISSIGFFSFVELNEQQAMSNSGERLASNDYID